MKNFELGSLGWIALIVCWILLVFLFYRWAYRRKGILGIILVFLLNILGVLIILLLSDDKNKN